MNRPLTRNEPRIRLGPLPLLSDINTANVAAGLTAGLWHVFGSLTLQLDAATRLHVSAQTAASWFFMVWMSGAIATIGLSLRYRQPVQVTANNPGLMLIATVGIHYTFPEVAGASLMAGIAIFVLGCLGIGARVMRWFPLSIVMGMLAGTLLRFATGIFRHLGAAPVVVGAALAGYVVARAVARLWLPPVAGAVAAGLGAAALAGQVHLEAFHWSPPVVHPLVPAFNASSALALSLPLVVMVVGLGNVSAAGILRSQGYRPPVNLITIVVGLNSVVNALFGGHSATHSRTPTGIVAVPDAGPAEQRYVASLIAALCALGLALSAATAGTLLGVLPHSLVATIAGLALLSQIMDALKKSTVTDLPLGSFFAFAIAASPLSFAGIPSAFWAIVGGWVVSFVLERPALLQAVWGAARG